MVRWLDGSLKPIGGWTTRKAGFSNNPVRGMHSWQSNDGTAWLSGGSHDQIIAMTGAGVCYDLTPDDLASGREDAAINTGYGFGFYGTGYYNQPREVTSDSIPQEATTWQLDNFGQNLIGFHLDDGRIWEWDLTTTVGSELVTNGDFVTDTNWTKGTGWSIANGVANYAKYEEIVDANSTHIARAQSDRFTITGHGFSDGDEITYIVPLGQTAVTGLTAGQNYFILSAAPDTFKLAATSGGSQIDLGVNKAVTFNANDPTYKDTTNNKFVLPNTFSDGDEVTYYSQAVSGIAGIDIGGLVNSTNYFIVNSSATEFQLAATSGGSPIDLLPDLNVSIDPDPITTSATSITVTVASGTLYGGGIGNIFYFDGVANPSLTLIKGTTYTFDLSDASNANHPLIFENGGSSYTTGITTTGIAGSAGASVAFTVDANAPSTGLAYLCGVHGGGMGNVITTVTAAGPINYVTDTITAPNHGFANDNQVIYSNGGGTDISGLTTGSLYAGPKYFIVGATTDTFQLSATSGGSAISLTAPSGSLGANHSFDLDIGSLHKIEQDIGSSHILRRINFGNLDQTVASLIATPDIQDSYDLTVTLIDPNTDNDAATIPDVKVKVTGTTNSIVSLDKTLAVGANLFRFGAPDTSVKIEIIPQAYNTPNFNIDNISLKKKTVVEPIANAPLSNKGMVVTEERFIFALGAGGNSRKVQWCDKENNTVWTPSATNEAGDIELATSGQIMCGVRTRGGTLIITDTDSHLAQYQGPPYVYGFQRVSTNSGAVSRLSVVATDQGAFWYGQENFHYFDGNSVQTLNCDVHDYVFNDFNKSQQSKVWGMVNGANNEVWWFYCSAGSTEIDRYVAYDFKDNHWIIGNLARTSGVSRGVFTYPFMAKHGTSTDIMNHEIGFNYEGEQVFCETGPISLKNGSQIAKVTSVITDEKTQGDVDLKFKSRFYPNDTERTFGPYNPSNPTSVRFTGRQVRMRVEGAQTTDWRVGTMRLDVKAGGKR